MSTLDVEEFWQARLNACVEGSQSSVRRLTTKIVEMREERANLLMQFARALTILKANDLLNDFCQDD